MKLEFAAALTYCTLPTLNSDQGIAVFVEDDGTVIGRGMHSGDPNQTHETAIANLCFNLKDAELWKIWCLTTYQPTPICTGIMDVRQMKKDRVVQLPPKKAFDSASPIRICSSGTEPPADWQNNRKAWLEAVIKASNEKRLSPDAKTIYDSYNSSYNSCPWVTKRTLPQDIYDIFSRLPASAPPAPNSLTWEGDEIYMRLAFAMVGETWNPVVRWDSKDTSGERLGGNNVGALIVNQNQIVSWGLKPLRPEPDSARGDPGSADLSPPQQCFEAAREMQDLHESPAVQDVRRTYRAARQ